MKRYIILALFSFLLTQTLQAQDKTYSAMREYRVSYDASAIDQGTNANEGFYQSKNSDDSFYSCAWANKEDGLYFRFHYGDNNQLEIYNDKPEACSTAFANSYTVEVPQYVTGKQYTTLLNILFWATNNTNDNNGFVEFLILSQTDRDDANGYANQDTHFEIVYDQYFQMVLTANDENAANKYEVTINW